MPIAGANPAARAKSTALTQELEAQPAAQARAAAPPARPDAKESVAASPALQTSEQKPASVPAAAPPAEKEAAPAQAPTAPDAPTAEAAQAPAAASAVSVPTGEEVRVAAASATAAATSAEQTAKKETALAPTAPAALPASTGGEKEQASFGNDDASHANDKAKAELASIQPGFVPKDLVAALNDSVINFPSDSAEAPASAADFLQKAAEELKQLPAGQAVEIAAYTDNTGDAGLNIELSQRRADAVRQALIMFGADSAKLMAKGYGGADPIASNETPDGRRRNLRIEYHLVKSP